MIHNTTKQVLAIHDLSCLGRCSLSIILPTLSALGSMVVPLPTALLSTQTDGYEDMTFFDLTETMSPALAHYKRLGLNFDAIYTGFLGSASQIDIVSQAIDQFSENALVIVDPVMGDNGKIYQTYTADMCRRMRELCQKASIITPNLTEAYILCDEEYRDLSALDIDSVLSEVERLTRKMSAMFKSVKKLAVTGIELPEMQVATVSYAFDSPSKQRCVSIFPRIDHGYPGTGDFFASVMLGSLLRGSDFHEAASFAARICYEVIADTSKYDAPRREGLLFEQNLYKLIDKR